MIFRRIGRRDDEPVMFRFFNQHVGIKLRRAFHDRIGPLQKFSVMREQISDPTNAGTATPNRRWTRPMTRRFARRSEAPRIRDDVRHPAARIVIILRRFRARFLQRSNQRKQRLRQIGKIANFRRPVIHLHIHVQMPVAIPRRVNFFRPNALQIRRQSARTRRRNQKITAKIKIQRRQARIAGAVLAAVLMRSGVGFSAAAASSGSS